MDRIELAREMAIKAHGKQKYGERPYLYHLEQVVEICRPYGEDAVIVAYLHDTIEDTSLTRAEIEEVFGPRVAASVAALSDPPGATRKERKKAAHEKLAKLTVYRQDVEGLVLTDECVALIVKVADRIANVSECIRGKNERLFKMYQEEQLDFRAAVHTRSWNETLVAKLDEIFHSGWPHPVADPIEQARREGAAVAYGLTFFAHAINDWYRMRRLASLCGQAHMDEVEDPPMPSEAEKVAAELAGIDIWATPRYARTYDGPPLNLSLLADSDDDS